MSQCALRTKEAIEENLALLVPEPKVFMDESGITGGAEWQETIRRALCRSISMVAICAPIYYHPSHEWCGLEWAAMNMLSDKRMPDVSFRAIIPVIVRASDPFPNAISKIQVIDFSKITVRGPRYYATQEYKTKILEIVNRIEEIAEAIVFNQAKPLCDEFQLPKTSAFLDYHTTSQPFPLRT
jgi:hypothetical protein